MADEVLQQWLKVIDDDLHALRALLSVDDVPVRPATYLVSRRPRSS